MAFYYFQIKRTKPLFQLNHSVDFFSDKIRKTIFSPPKRGHCRNSDIRFTFPGSETQFTVLGREMLINPHFDMIFILKLFALQNVLE
jgi:hypothetical protein